MSNYRTLVVYCYYEDINTKKNLEFFIKEGIILSPNYHYVFTVGGGKHTLIFPEHPNVRVIVRNDNEDDIATHKYTIQTLTPEFIDTFDRIYFMNSSCIGPFLPPICSDNWIELFNRKLESVDIFGPIVQFHPRTKLTFIHTYMFGVNRFGWNVMKSVILSKTFRQKTDAISFENEITNAVIVSGGKFGHLLSRFRDVDLTDSQNRQYTIWNSKNRDGCYEIPGNYFGIDVHPFEVVFVKNIRRANATRSTCNAGISTTLSLYLNRYIQWYGNREKKPTHSLIMAQYGIDDSFVDVLELITRLSQNNIEEFVVSNSTFGIDPKSGKTKQLRVEFTDHTTSVFSERSVVSIRSLSK